MLEDNPILTMLGRRGRGAVVDTLVGAPGRTWSVRGLARAAGVSAATAARAAKELEALGAIDVVRPGRDARLHLNASPVAAALGGLRLPDVRRGATEGFAAAYAYAAPLVCWQAPGEHPADPAVPTRIAILAAEDEALDAVGPALDAVRSAGWPAPEVTTWSHESLEPQDPVARAILAGTHLGPRPGPATTRRSGT